MGQLRRGLLALIFSCTAISASAEPIGLTYSYSNLLDGTLFTVLTSTQLRSATEEALGLWSRYAPIEFVEVPDAGPPPSDRPYPADETPDIRIGHHDAVLFTHAFYPWAGGGLARDVHLRTRYADPFYWGLGDDPSIYCDRHPRRPGPRTRAFAGARALRRRPIRNEPNRGRIQGPGNGIPVSTRHPGCPAPVWPWRGVGSSAAGSGADA